MAVYQLLCGALDVDPHGFFEMAAERTPATREHPWRLTKPRVISRIRRNAFSSRVINDWNSLAAAVVACDALNQFKKQLYAHWTHIAHDILHTDK